MRTHLLYALTLLVACAGANQTDPLDAGREAEAPAIDAGVEASPADASPDGTALLPDGDSPDAGDVDAGPALGRACDLAASDCESFGSGRPGVCYPDPGSMFERCTFECWRFNPGPGDLIIQDPGKANACTSLGGVCAVASPGKRHVCAVP